MNHKGWHSRGYLPHFDSAETVQFVTFRLADSLPRTVAEALAKLAENLAETDRRLDCGYGSCWLKQPLVAQAVQNAILHFDGERYRLLMSEPEARGPEEHDIYRAASVPLAYGQAIRPSAISRSLLRWILKPLGEGVLGKSSTAKTRSGTL